MHTTLQRSTRRECPVTYHLPSLSKKTHRQLPTKAPPSGQTSFGNEAPREAEGVTTAQRAVCCGVSTLGGGRGRWAEEEGVSSPNGSEEGRWEEVVRTQKVRKQRESEWG